MVATVHPIRRRRFHGHHDSEAAARELEAQRLHELAEDERLRARQEALYVTGRLVVAFVFIVSALSKALSFREDGGAVLWLSIAIELIAGAMLALGLQARRAATVLLVWLGLGTLFFHGDLNLDADRALTLANVAMCGALFVFVAYGGGLLSVDQFQRRHSSS